MCVTHRGWEFWRVLKPRHNDNEDSKDHLTLKNRDVMIVQFHNSSSLKIEHYFTIKPFK